MIILVFLVLVVLVGCANFSSVATTGTTSTSSTSSISTTTGNQETTTNPLTTAVPDTSGTTVSMTTLTQMTISSGSNAVSYDYDKILESDLLIDLCDYAITIEEIQTYSGTPFADTWATYTGNNVLIKWEYLETLQLGEGYFLLETSAGLLDLVINVTDTRKPEITSPVSVIYQMDTDLVFEYEVYAGEFVMISGNDITADDYTYDDDSFTIDFDYMHGKFLESSEREALILQVLFNYPEGVVYNIIFIYKPQS